MTQKIHLKTDDEQFVALYKAIANSGKLRGEPNPKDEHIEDRVRPFSEELAKWLETLNPWAQKMWADYLSDQAYPKQTSKSRLFCVSLLSKDWQIDLGIPRSAEQLHQLVLAIIPKLKQDVRNSLGAKSDFLMVIDVAFHVVDKRRFLCLHVHGFVWGEEQSLKNIMKKYPPIIGDAPGGEFEPCKDRQGWASYQFKDARLKTITNRLPDYKNGRPRYTKPSQVLTKENQLILIEALGDLTKPEMTFAGGKGSIILRAAKKAAVQNGYEAPVRSVSL